MNTTADDGEKKRQLRELCESLNALVDQDPRAAIEMARQLSDDDFLAPTSIDALKAGPLIDAGTTAQDKTAVDEGVDALRRLLEDKPPRAELQYCLANGLTAQAGLVPYAGANWYLETDDLRREARVLYRAAGQRDVELSIGSRAYANLGNALLSAHRLIEAYDCYLAAIGRDHSNGIALTGAAKILLHFAASDVGDRRVLLGVAAKHLKVAQENSHRIRELAGAQAYEELAPLLEADTTGGEPPDLSRADDYQRFVAKHRLALAPTIEGLEITNSRWDSLRIGRVTEPLAAEHGVPPIFAMFNVLKSEYLAARFLAYLALTEALPDSGDYSDTLDYARYGTEISVLTLAQRSCVDLLDKLAVAASEYFDLPGPTKSIYFRTRWFETNEPLRWQARIGEEIDNGNTALIALSEVARDISEDGFLHEKRVARNSSTHRFTVLHDLGESAYRESKHIDHYGERTFVDQLVETLQLARATLFYFVEMINLHEKHHAKRDNLILPSLVVPDHHWVRGDEEE